MLSVSNIKIFTLDDDYEFCVAINPDATDPIEQVFVSVAFSAILLSEFDEVQMNILENKIGWYNDFFRSFSCDIAVSPGNYLNRKFVNLIGWLSNLCLHSESISGEILQELSLRLNNPSEVVNISEILNILQQFANYNNDRSFIPNVKLVRNVSRYLVDVGVFDIKKYDSILVTLQEKGINRLPGTNDAFFVSNEDFDKVQEIVNDIIS